MGLLNRIAVLRQRWMGKRRAVRRADDGDLTRPRRFEPMEPRRMLDAHPLFLGAVYIEEDAGSDMHGDTFEVTFEGGAAETRLTRLLIDGDQIGNFGNLNGLSAGDVFFDTSPSASPGLGADGAQPFTLIQVLDSEGKVKSDALAGVSVVDGTTRLELQFADFVAGDRLVFTIDVDEVEVYDPRVSDIDEINDGFDPLTSGAEFQGTQITASFSAPHYFDAVESSVFLNRYDSAFAEVAAVLGAEHALDLPADAQRGPDRTAGAVVQAQQEALPISISGTVFHDRNLNLQQEASLQENGIAGVKISLYVQGQDGGFRQATDQEGRAVSTVSDANGDYHFGAQWDLKPGVYQVRQQQPAGYPISVGAIPGSVTGAASGRAKSVNVLSDIHIPLGGTSAVDYDFAEAQPSTISGYVYHDRDNDGRRETAEEGIEGVLIRALDADGNVAGSARTDQNGFYSISGLAPGQYVLRQSHPSAWIDGLDTAGAIERIGQGQVLVGVAHNPGNAITAVELWSGETGVHYNFGERLGSIEGYVHWDANENCLFEENETGIANVEIVLTDQEGHSWTTRTDARGRYRFVDLKVGDYTVRELQPGGFFQAGQHVGDGGGDGARANQISGIHIGEGEQIHLKQYNFCETRGSLSGYVYHDRDNDGQRESQRGEEAIAGVALRLFHAETGRPALDEQGRELVAITNEDGYYEFADLAPGVYRLVEQHPQGWIDGKDTPGLVNGLASGSAANADFIDLVDLGLDSSTQGRKDGVEYNFGERLGSIQGYVHWDLNNDCVFDENEMGIEGVQITLTDGQGNTWMATTDSRGGYRFDDLMAGSYTVFQAQPADFFHGGQRVGSGTGDASVANQVSGIVVGAGRQVHLSGYNFCETRGSLSGFVYHDRDQDGIREAGRGEEAIAGVTMKLYDAETGAAVLDEAGQRLVSVTDRNGYYEFLNLAPGLYRVVQQQPAGWIDGLDTPGNVNGKRSGRSIVARDRIDQIDMRQADAGQNRLVGTDFNFGERLGSIEGWVHFDQNRNCVRDGNEPGIEGVTVILSDSQGNTWTATTDDEGRYRFEGLRTGVYSLREIQPENYFDGGVLAGDGGGDASTPNLIGGIVLGAGDEVQLSGYHFCETRGQISGFVYHDRDNDGRREPGANEEAIQGVVVRLYDANGSPVLDDAGQPLTAATNQSGYYAFRDLAPGVYRVVEDQPVSWMDGRETPGTVNGRASGSVPRNADAIDAIDAIDLRATGSDQTRREGVNYNFAERLGSIEGSVHVDNDGDCLLDDGEQGIAGVTITLIDQDGARRTTRTDAKGRYRFDDLQVGTYKLVERQPEEFFDGRLHVGNGSGDGSMPNVISGISVGAGPVRLLNYNFCETRGSLSGHVYHDADNDGIRRAREETIAGVTLTLFDDGGRPVMGENGKPRITTTDAHGYYEFLDLQPGRYRIVETQPAGWLDGVDRPGKVEGARTGTAAVGGDQIDQIDLSGAIGRQGVNFDFGELLPGSISGIVHTDLNNNCVFEPLSTVLFDEPELVESGLSGVTVQLLDEQGKVIDSTTTDRDGHYRFDGLAPGTYSVRELQPQGFFHGGQLASTDVDNSTPDLLSRIEIDSGADLTGFHFCEIPPAQIAGRVFQDGPTILTTDAGPLRNLRQLRDGRFDASDTPIPGVVIQLRDGFTGLPVDASIALPGTYPAGPIQVLTDARGEYLFTGLPRGNYAVFEVQPEGYIDGIDTPGTRAGFAFNLGEATPLSVVATLAASHSDDAIVRIAMPSGARSLENNFSEVRRGLQPGLLIERQDPPPLVEVPPTDNPLIPPELPITPLARMEGTTLNFSGNMLFTWHLSVIDGGKPRGGTSATSDVLSWHSAAMMTQAKWDSTQLNFGRWTVPQIAEDGSVELRQFQFGAEDAIPVVGDFNGDGVSELGLFFQGEWFIDLNGNGRWDLDDLWAKLGEKGDKPVTGDWDGDGKDDIGIYGPAWPGDPRAIEVEPGLPDPANRPVTRPKNMPPKEDDATGKRLLQLTKRGEQRTDLIDHVFRYGVSSDVPVAGDWNGDGIHAIGVFRNGRWNLDMNGDGKWSEGDVVVEYGKKGDLPVVGDFDGDGIDNIGVFRAGSWILDVNGNHELDAHDRVFQMGDADDIPVVGDFSGDGVDEVGVYRQTQPKENDVTH